MSRITPSQLIIAIAIAAAVPLAAQAPVRIRLATLAPDNSPWHNALLAMGASWSKATNGRVVLKVFTGGSIASESSAVSDMDPKVNGLEAAALMVAGLAEIDPAFNVFGIPFFFQSDEELADVQQKLTPLLSKRLEAKGYHLLSWANAGWVQVFSKMPIRTLGELKKARLYTTEGEPRMVQWYTQNGFNAKPLAPSQIPTQLRVPTGGIEAAPSPPYFALALQFFRDAPYMLDLRVAPLTGATVITDLAWKKIAPDDRPKLIDAAAAMEKTINGQASTLDASAVRDMTEAMKASKTPFQVIKLDASAAAEFHAEADKLAASQRSTDGIHGMVAAEVFDAAVQARDAFRKSRLAGR